MFPEAMPDHQPASPRSTSSVRSVRSTRSVRSAFTLIELLTVIAIIGILAGILIPVVSSVRNKAKAVEGLSQMRQLAFAVLAYTSESRNGALPGPVNSASQPFSYTTIGGSNWRANHLMTWIHPYLGLPTPLPGHIITEAPIGVMTGPQRVLEAQRKANNEDEYAFITVPFASNENPKNHPFGYKDKGFPPHSIHSIENPSAVDTSNPPESLKTNSMLRTADKDSAFISAGKRCPDKPIHGDRRHVAYFDGHVRSFSIAETNRVATP
ncbi:MAG: prepilin-type N-terminal cleavage/methylation domain-containing protein [Opitutaceae bacterium]|jgi:prepilin-type N-terminal cleavage/methylation domain-containing protein/prepilin-type processing-associated H-X9-DG protein|nr:prepilin-type N-terminal cleavage/methylation domain-containing protein [Opitutaceae bacterium]